MTAETITRDIRSLQGALDGLFAMVRGEVPSLLEDHIQFAMCAEALDNARDIEQRINTRLAAARAEGVREGIEMAAKWHDDQAAELERRITSREGQFVSGMDRTARIHREDARMLRSLAPAPAEAPTTPTVEASAPVADYMIACGQHADARRVAEEQVAALEAENEKLRETLGSYPNPSKYGGMNGFEEQRFFADYDTFRSRARALLQGQGGAS